MFTDSHSHCRRVTQIRRHMSGVDREAVEPLILGIDASGVPIEHRLSGGVSSVGDGEMVPG